MTELKTIKQLNKFFVTKFEPKKIEKEMYGDHTYKEKVREPSEFEGKTIAIECSGRLIDMEDLRQEAIKQLKYCEECMEGQHNIGFEIKNMSLGFQSIYHAKTWIKNFFNITYEEIEEVKQNNEEDKNGKRTEDETSIECASKGG